MNSQVYFKFCSSSTSQCSIGASMHSNTNLAPLFSIPPLPLPSSSSFHLLLTCRRGAGDRADGCSADCGWFLAHAGGAAPRTRRACDTRRRHSYRPDTDRACLAISYLIDLGDSELNQSIQFTLPHLCCYQLIFNQHHNMSLPPPSIAHCPEREPPPEHHRAAAAWRRVLQWRRVAQPPCRRGACLVCACLVCACVFHVISYHS